jgi:hypothetical protein
MGRFMQLVLDLFEVPSNLSEPSPPKTQPLEGPHQPAEPLGHVLPKAKFTHPHATRRIQLGTTDVSYAFRRGKRRTIGMSVGPDGLEVRAPTWVTVGEVESALREKADWISRKLVEMGERQAHMGASRIVWCDGVVLPYLGGQLKVVLDSTRALKKNSAQFEVSHAVSSPHTLRLGLPLHATPEQIRDAVQAWLMRHAKVLFTERLQHFAPLLQVQWQRLSLSSAATRWGSASASGAIRLNWRLVHHKLEVIDYVVVHELSHLRVMDHSPRFWDTVKTVMPAYAEHRRVLKDEPLPPWS